MLTKQLNKHHDWDTWQASPSHWATSQHTCHGCASQATSQSAWTRTAPDVSAGAGPSRPVSLRRRQAPVERTWWLPAQQSLRIRDHWCWLIFHCFSINTTTTTILIVIVVVVALYIFHIPILCCCCCCCCSCWWCCNNIQWLLCILLFCFNAAAGGCVFVFCACCCCGCLPWSSHVELLALGERMLQSPLVLLLLLLMMGVVFVLLLLMLLVTGTSTITLHIT